MNFSSRVHIPVLFPARGERPDRGEFGTLMISLSANELYLILDVLLGLCRQARGRVEWDFPKMADVARLIRLLLVGGRESQPRPLFPRELPRWNTTKA